MNTGVERKTLYSVICVIVLIILAVLFTFPLYWIITGAFKTGASINSPVPDWWPKEWVLSNFEKLFSKQRVPLWEFFGMKGPKGPAAIVWLVNTVFVSVMAMVLTCITASLAGYALAKKRFAGRHILFTLIVCAMALPKQVILIPLIKEISFLGLYNNLWAIILPTVGWPFGVFLMKQFSEGIPGEMLESARIDGAGEIKTFLGIVFPMVKPGVGALAIFTFINCWNDYFLQLIMLSSTKNLTISIGIATLQSQDSTDYGLIMAGATLASVPIIAVFIIFQQYFTKGITLGAVKG